MKLNLKVRLRNPVFWFTIIPSLTAFIYTFLSVFGVTPSISEDTLINALTTIVTALATLGVLVDPTTSGVNDSERALTYEKPNS